MVNKSLIQPVTSRRGPSKNNRPRSVARPMAGCGLQLMIATRAPTRERMLPWSDRGRLLALQFDDPRLCLSQTCIVWGKGKAAGNPWPTALLCLI